MAEEGGMPGPALPRLVPRSSWLPSPHGAAPLGTSPGGHRPAPPRWPGASGACRSGACPQEPQRADRLQVIEAARRPGRSVDLIGALAALVRVGKYVVDGQDAAGGQLGRPGPVVRPGHL